MPIPVAFIVPHPPLIVPQIGRGQESAIRKTADSYHQVARRIAGLRPDTIILFTPHGDAYADYIHISPGHSARGSLAQFGAGEEYHVQYDDGLADAICACCQSVGFSAGTSGQRNAALDHGTIIPLYFINQYYTGYRLVRIALSGLSREEHYRFGSLVRQAVEETGRSAVVVASGDLSHKLTADGPYGYAPEGPDLDKTLTGCMADASFGTLLTLPDALSRRGADCGLQSFVMMAGTLDKQAIQPELLSYEGPYGVGYAVAAFTVTGDDPDRAFLDRRQAELARKMEDRRAKEDEWVRLARVTLETFLRTGGLPEIPRSLPAALTDGEAGVFVSIKKHGQLRGCIGTISPTHPTVAEEIINNAISAGTQDPRFSPVQADELEDLVYSVDVLFPAEAADMEMLDPIRYGVIVSSGRKRGLLLPNLEEVDTAELQVRIACEKAGIAPGESYTLERFEVVRHT